MIEYFTSLEFILCYFANVCKEISNQILCLSDASFGIDYLTAIELEGYYASCSSDIITLEKDGIIQGFSIVQVVSPEELKEILFCEIPKPILELEKIGYRKMTAVSPEFQRIGVAKRLFESGNNWMKEHGAEVILSAVWIKKGKTTFGQMLVKQGFEPLVFAKNYWKNDSLKRKFICPVCGEPPCECDAMVYAKFNV